MVLWHDDSKRWVMVAAMPDQHKVRVFAPTELRKRTAWMAGEGTPHAAARLWPFHSTWRPAEK